MMNEEAERHSSAFTTVCAHQAKGAWQATAGLFAWYGNRRVRYRQENSAASRAGTGCVGCLLMGPTVIVYLLPALVITAGGAAIAAYALVMSALAGIGSLVDRIWRRGWQKGAV